MTASLFRLYRASGATVAVAAPGPSDGWFVASPDGVGVIIARLDSARQSVWQKRFDLDDAADDFVRIAASADRSTFAVSCGSLSTLTLDPTIEVALFQSDGTMLWHRILALEASGTVSSLVLTPAGDVLVSGKAIGNETMLVKLTAASGATSWSVRINSTAASVTTHILDGLDTLSTGDPVVVFRDAQNSPVLTNGLSSTHVQRLSGSDGSITWTKWLSWPDSMASAESAASIGIDPSDNIYVCGARYTASGRSAAPVLKLASDGSTVWSRSIETPASQGGRGLLLTCLPRAISASSSGVLIPFAPSTDAVESNVGCGLMYVASAGTVGAGTVPLVELVLQRTGTGGANPFSAPGAGSIGVYTAADTTGANEFAVVFTSSELTSYDQTFGPYERKTLAFDLASGTSTSSTRSFTRATAPSVANDPGVTGTTTSTSLLIEAYPGGVQLPWSPTTAFGSPSIATTAGEATGFTTTAFGTAVSGRRVDASALAPGTNFGTAVQTWDRFCAADSTAPTLAFGFAVALSDLPTALPAGYATSLDATAQVGEPTASSALTVPAATVGLTSVVGTPLAGVRLGVTSAAPATEVGTPSSGFRGRATGARGTAFGFPSIATLGLSTGVLRTNFGTPAARASVACSASGTASTAFGAPASRYGVRVRSAYFRTNFGLGTTERTQP